MKRLRKHTNKSYKESVRKEQQKDQQQQQQQSACWKKTESVLATLAAR